MPRGINQGLRSRPSSQPVHTTRGAGFMGGEAPDLLAMRVQLPHRPAARDDLGPKRVFPQLEGAPYRQRVFHFRGFPGRGRFDY